MARHAGLVPGDRQPLAVLTILPPGTSACVLACASSPQGDVHLQVVDSPFARLTELMLELVEEQKIPIPKAFMRVALSMMRRSVRKRASFSLDAVAPLELAPQAYIPALFGACLPWLSLVGVGCILYGWVLGTRFQRDVFALALASIGRRPGSCTIFSGFLSG